MGVLLTYKGMRIVKMKMMEIVKLKIMISVIKFTAQQ